MPGWNWQKINQMLSNTLRLNFCYLKVINTLHSHYHPKIIGHILKNMQKNKCLYWWNYMINHNENEDGKESRQYWYNKNKSWSRNGGKYSICKKCLSMLMLICIKACICYFLNFYFSPNDSPSKTMKDVFFSSKKLFSFSRYSNVCISTFPSFSPSQPLLESLIQDKS